MKYKEYVTVDGDFPALIAHKQYGKSSLVSWILQANPDALLAIPLPAGMKLDIPILEDTVIAKDLPPWKVSGPEDDDEVEVPTGDDDVIVTPPPLQLLFFPGYPRVVGNRIEFAITQTRTETYQIEKSNGTIIENSPSYVFSAGYVVQSQEIPNGGLYRVKIGSLVSGYMPVLGHENPLTFERIPTFVIEAGVRKVKFAPAFGGAYSVLVAGPAPDYDVVYSQSVNLVQGVDVVVTVPEDGVYKIAIGPLEGSVNVFTEVPDLEITKLAITNDVNSRDTTFYTKSSVLMDMKMDPMDGSTFQGLTEPNGPVTNGQWIPGTTQWAGVNFDQVFRFNPLAPGQGGIIPGRAYKLSFRAKGTTTPVIEKIYTIPVTTNLYPPTDIILEEGPVGQACAKGPIVYSMVSFSKEMVSWNMDGDGIEKLRLFVEDTDTDTVVRTVDVDFVKIVNGVKVPVFNPGYRAVVFFEEDLEPGNYRIGTKGLNCDSPTYWGTPFELEEDGTVDPGPDPGEQTGDYIVRVATFPFPGEMKIQMTAMEDGLGRNVTDLVSSSKNPNVNIWYMVNENPKIVDRLINLPWRFPGPLSIRKIRLENWITEPIQTGGETAWTPVRGIQSFDSGGSYAQFDAVAVKQNT